MITMAIQIFDIVFAKASSTRERSGSGSLLMNGITEYDISTPGGNSAGKEAGRFDFRSF
jgi:hypothetical protein